MMASILLWCEMDNMKVQALMFCFPLAPSGITLALLVYPPDGASRIVGRNCLWMHLYQGTAPSLVLCPSNPKFSKETE